MYSRHLGLSLAFIVAQTVQFPGGFCKQPGKLPPPDPPAPELLLDELLLLLDAPLEELLLDELLLLLDEPLPFEELLLETLDEEVPLVLAVLELDPELPPVPAGGRSGSTP